MVPKRIMTQQQFQQAMQMYSAGRLPQAEEICRRILADTPEHADALHLLGAAALQRGRLKEAEDFLQRAVQAYRDPGDLSEAHSNLGIVLMNLGRPDAAKESLEKAVALNPKSDAGWNNLGTCRLSQGDWQSAEQTFRKAIALNPGLPDAHNNLGNALRTGGRVEEAITAYRQSVKLAANNAEVFNNLGIALAMSRQFDEAMESFRRALALRPDFANALNNLGTAFFNTGRIEAAIDSCSRAAAIQPGNPAIASNPAYFVNFHPDYDSAAILRENLKWNERFAIAPAKQIQPHRNDRSQTRRLKIGYVSAFFRNHPVAFCLDPILAGHDREHFKIHCYADVPRPDDVTRRLRSHSVVWRDIAGMDNPSLADLIRADGIDILIDSMMHLENNRLPLFAAKPAPVQVAWLAYPGTTGLSAIDYRLTDPYLDPAASNDENYSEKSIRLPDSFWCYDPLIDDLAITDLPARSAGQITFGCLNNFCKVNRVALGLWSKVLAATPNSRLILLCPAGAHRADVLTELGVDALRVEFIDHQPRPQYLQTYNRIDLGLDTFPYNGHMTSLDSIWMGVPVVSLCGSTVVSRAGWSQASNLGLANDLVAQSPDDFVKIAIALAADLPRLSQLRQTLRQRLNRSPMMDSRTFVRNLESAYRQIWER